MKEISASELNQFVGAEIGLSDWLAVDQHLVDAFAGLTGDRQFIHVDPARAAAEGPFGTTIAHGLLTLSLLPAMAMTAVPRIRGVRSSVNYGFDRVRFVAPVPTGSRVRGRFVLKRYEPRGADAVLTVWELQVQVEGCEQPALIAEWLVLRYLDKEAA